MPDVTTVVADLGWGCCGTGRLASAGEGNPLVDDFPRHPRHVVPARILSEMPPGGALHDYDPAP